jgi:hypothetical protein
MHGKTKPHKAMSLSTAEAEYCAASTAAVDSASATLVASPCSWFASQEHGLPAGCTPVFDDSNACIEWSNDVIGGRERLGTLTFGSTSRMKRSSMVAFALLMVAFAIQHGRLRLTRVSTTHQLADLFTTSLQPRRHAAPRASRASASRGPQAVDSRSFVKDAGTHEGNLDVSNESKQSHADPYEGRVVDSGIKARVT